VGEKANEKLQSGLLSFLGLFAILSGKNNDEDYPEDEHWCKQCH
jgi:hypothetical protein